MLSPSVAMPTITHNAAAEVAYISGCGNSRYQSSSSAAGTRVGSARAAEATGSASAAASSVASVPSASARGVTVLGSPMRWTWIHIPASSASGSPMCRNTNSEKIRSPMASPPTKLPANVPPPRRRPSSHSAVASAEYCARASHTSQ